MEQEQIGSDKGYGIETKKDMDWLKDSGMKVNESKTDLCLFHRGDSTPISLNLYGKIVTSNKKINVLGVIFVRSIDFWDLNFKVDWSYDCSQPTHPLKKLKNVKF